MFVLTLDYQADAKRAEQQAQYEASISNNDPAS